MRDRVGDGAGDKGQDEAARVVSGMAETMRTEPDEDDEDERDWQLLPNLLS